MVHLTRNKTNNRPRRWGLSVLLFCIILLFLSACTKKSEYVPPEGTSFRHLEPDEAAKMIEEGCTLVDVRGEPQYDLEHIPGAINIPYDAPDDDFYTALPDKDAQILLYCDYGGISKDAAERLSGDLGYKNVSEFDGLLVWEGETESNIE